MSAIKFEEDVICEFNEAFKDWKLNDEFEWTESGEVERLGWKEQHFGWWKDNKVESHIYVFIYLEYNHHPRITMGFGNLMNCTKTFERDQYDEAKSYINSRMTWYNDFIHLN